MRDDSKPNSTLLSALIVMSLCCSGLLLFLWGLSSQEIIGFESRFYLFVLEMWRHKLTWFPTTYQQPYPDYPITSTIFIYLSSLLFRNLNKLSAVLPTAIMATLTIIITYYIGALHHKYWGLCAALFLFLTLSFIQSARSLTLDLYPTMVTTGCFYLMHSAHLNPRHSNRMVWVDLLLLFGFALRGPIGFIIPSSIIGMYYLFSKQYKKLTHFSARALGLFILGTLILFIAAYKAGGKSFMQAVLQMEIIGRMVHQTTTAFYFYYYAGLIYYFPIFPLSLLVGYGIIHSMIFYKKYPPESDCLLKLCGWAGIVLIGMSIPTVKKMRYILPILPALALLSAYPLVFPAKEKYFLKLKEYINNMLLYTPLFLFITTGLVYNITTLHSLHYIKTIILCGMTQCIAWLIRSYSLILLLIVTLLTNYTYLTLIEPIITYTEQGKSTISLIEAKRKEIHAKLAFYKENPDGFPIKYLAQLPYSTQPLFINHAYILTHLTHPALLIAQKDHYQQLSLAIKRKFPIVATTHLYHRNMIIFSSNAIQPFQLPSSQLIK